MLTNYRGSDIILFTKFESLEYYRTFNLLVESERMFYDWSAHGGLHQADFI